MNVFVGRNAQGKSNLLEAISVLGTGKSFRTSRERDLIRGDGEIASVAGEAVVRAGAIRLGCTIAGGSRGTRKTYTMNGRGVRYGTFLGSLRVVTFVPSDLRLVDGPPAGRRAFLNGAIAQGDKRYYHELARYQKALAQKSALLRADSPDESLLQIYDETLVSAGTALTLARDHFVRALAVEAAQAHERWSEGTESLNVRYEPNVPYEAPTEDCVAAALAERLRSIAALERARQTPLAGPHRDELGLSVGAHSLAAYGSQGQQRTAVLSLKVAEYAIMRERSGEAPLLLLDDVLSELDAGRADAFLQGVGAFEQAYVTATHLPERLPAAKMFTVERAAVSEVRG